MRSERGKTTLRCAIYTRVSTEHGLEQEFNSLDNQREASEAYVKSQAHEGWKLIRTHYDDGGYSGGSMDRPALERLLDDVRARRIDVIVVYKVDRLTRSLADFAKLVELFDSHQVSFVSVTQAFNTTTSMGRLTLNVLLSFAQFEREVTGERIRDKIAASKRKGIWMGGVVPLGYRVENRALHVVEEHAAFVRDLIRRYLEIGSVVRLKAILDQEDTRLPLRNPLWHKARLPDRRQRLRLGGQPGMAGQRERYYPAHPGLRQVQPNGRHVFPRRLHFRSSARPLRLPRGQRAGPIPTHLRHPQKRRHSRGHKLYRASKLDCDVCVLKARCCPNAVARKIPRDLNEDSRDIARALASTPEYETACRRRKKIEMLFAHLKRILGLARLRLRGPNGAKDEFLLAATAQNLRRLARLRPITMLPQMLAA